MTNISYSMASKEDVNNLFNLEKNSMSHPWSMELISGVIENERGGAIKATDLSNDKIAGYVNFTYVLDELEIGNICVESDYRRQGIAQNLLRSLVDFANEHNIVKIFLEVSSINIPAQNLYNKFGFKSYSVRKAYYNANEDAIMMVFDV